MRILRLAAAGWNEQKSGRYQGVSVPNPATPSNQMTIRPSSQLLARADSYKAPYVVARLVNQQGGLLAVRVTRDDVQIDNIDIPATIDRWRSALLSFEQRTGQLSNVVRQIALLRHGQLRLESHHPSSDLRLGQFIIQSVVMQGQHHDGTLQSRRAHDLVVGAVSISATTLASYNVGNSQWHRLEILELLDPFLLRVGVGTSAGHIGMIEAVGRGWHELDVQVLLRAIPQFWQILWRNVDGRGGVNWQFLDLLSIPEILDAAAKCTQNMRASTSDTCVHSQDFIDLGIVERLVRSQIREDGVLWSKGFLQVIGKLFRGQLWCFTSL